MTDLGYVEDRTIKYEIPASPMLAAVDLPVLPLSW